MTKPDGRRLERLSQAISQVQIQGATAVAKATLDGLAQFLGDSGPPSKASDWQGIIALADDLSKARPTEPLARNLSRWFISELKLRRQKSRPGGLAWFDAVAKLVEEIHYQLKEIEVKIAATGSQLIRAGEVIFTHCHSSLAESILIRAKQQKKKFKVYHTETRPLFQGRITSRHLTAVGIEATMVADSAAAWLVSNHSGDDIPVSWVLLGADSIAADGSVINKIGSFGIALSAYDSGIPVYVASSLLKLDAKGESQIEIRPRDEIWPGAPRGTAVINYAFDCLPAKYITALVTEFGLIKPRQVLKVTRQKYPWLENKN